MDQDGMGDLNTTLRHEHFCCGHSSLVPKEKIGHSGYIDGDAGQHVGLLCVLLLCDISTHDLMQICHHIGHRTPTQLPLQKMAQMCGRSQVGVGLDLEPPQLKEVQPSFSGTSLFSQHFVSELKDWTSSSSLAKVLSPWSPRRR